MLNDLQGGGKWAKGLGEMMVSSAVPGSQLFPQLLLLQRRHSRKVWGWRGCVCVLHLTHPVMSWLLALVNKKINLCSVWSLDTPIDQRGRNKMQRKVFYSSDTALPFRKNVLQH